MGAGCRSMLKAPRSEPVRLSRAEGWRAERGGWLLPFSYIIRRGGTDYHLVRCLPAARLSLNRGLPVYIFTSYPTIKKHSHRSRRWAGHRALFTLRRCMGIGREKEHGMYNTTQHNTTKRQRAVAAHKRPGKRQRAVAAHTRP